MRNHVLPNVHFISYDSLHLLEIISSEVISLGTYCKASPNFNSYKQVVCICFWMMQLAIILALLFLILMASATHKTYPTLAWVIASSVVRVNDDFNCIAS